MREILFRGKRVDNGKWVYGFYCHYNDTEDNGKDDCDYIIEKHNGDHFPFVEVSPETICQYTGLTDKNGNKIFEGDTLKLLGSKLYKVYFDKAEARFQMNGCDDEHAFHKCVSFCEIVGNIHDNPELTDSGWEMRQ